ncbi:hypothetical protein [Streptococcus fryi]
MIKLFLKSETGDFITYDYYVNDKRDSDSHGIVKVSKIDKSYKVIKKDNSPFNAWAHAVRFALSAIEEEYTEQTGTVAWY